MVVHKLFRSSRPDYIETTPAAITDHAPARLFRSSRPDYIETVLIVRCPVEHVTILFRSSRPDYIETP